MIILHSDIIKLLIYLFIIFGNNMLLDATHYLQESYSVIFYVSGYKHKQLFPWLTPPISFRLYIAEYVKDIFFMPAA